MRVLVEFSWAAHITSSDNNYYHETDQIITNFKNNKINNMNLINLIQLQWIRTEWYNNNYYDNNYKLNIISNDAAHLTEPVHVVVSIIKS